MQTVAHENAARLAARGHEVTFLVSSDPRDIARLKHTPIPPGVEVIRFDRGSNPVAFVRNGRLATKKLALKRSIDIVHIHFAYAALGPRFAIPRHVPTVRTYHGAWDSEAFLETTLKTGRATIINRIAAAARYSIEMAISQNSDRIVTLSSFAKSQIMERFHIPAERIVEIPAGANERFRLPMHGRQEIRDRLGIPGDAMVLMTACRLVELKGVRVLIDAVTNVIKQYPKTLCLIVGDGPSRAGLEDKVRQAGLSTFFRFEGFIGNNIVDYYQASNLFVNPSLASETMGLVSLEALACGIPVVGMPLGATPELLNAIDQRLVSKGVSPAELTAVIVQAVEIANDVSFSRKAISDFVRAKYCWDSHAIALERVFYSCLERTAKNVVARSFK